MKYILFILAGIYYQPLYAQDTNWEKTTIDSNITAELPGAIERTTQSPDEKYTYEVFSGRIDSALFSVNIVTSKEEVDINNQEDYNSGMNDMVRGAIDGMKGRGLKAAISDTVLDGVTGKKIVFSGKMASLDILMINYSFLVNGKFYTISGMFIGPALTTKDSSHLAHLLSSVEFNENRRETRFDTRVNSMAYHSGRIIGILIISCIIIGVIIYVVRNI